MIPASVAFGKHDEVCNLMGDFQWKMFIQRARNHKKIANAINAMCIQKQAERIKFMW